LENCNQGAEKEGRGTQPRRRVVAPTRGRWRVSFTHKKRVKINVARGGV